MEAAKHEASGTAAPLASAATIVVFIVGMIMPIVLAVLLWLAPDRTQRAGDAGTFVSASTSGGGFLSSPITSVQTSSGTIAVIGAFSGLHGQQLRIRDGIKSGLQLCVDGSLNVQTSRGPGPVAWCPFHIGAA